MVSKREANKQRTARIQTADAAKRAGGRKKRRQRKIVGAMAAIVSLAMIVPLAAGIIAIATGGSSSSSATTVTLPSTTITIPSFVDPGRTITGDMTCPATDGTEVRTTTFSGPPPMCIDTQSTYSATLSTASGEVVFNIDPSLDVEAANLFIVLAQFGFFDGLPVYTSSIGGPAISGDAGGIDPGFSVLATPITTTTSTDISIPAESPYQIGDVVMAADTNQRLDTRFAVLMNQDVVDALATNPVNPVIGTVTSGLDVLRTIVDDPATVLGDVANIGSWLDGAIRIDSISVNADPTP